MTGQAKNPYLIAGPAIISFSGGRTSAFMLHEILKAHDGALPDDVVVLFANTGKERPETLRFVHECGVRWGVKIVWLEFMARSGDRAKRFETVNYNNASKAGEPFQRLIASKKYTPNGVARFCTEELKVNTIANYISQELGWTSWLNIVGLRHDEGHRCLKAYARNAEGKSPWVTYLPLDKARVSKANVSAFWDAQDFDLGLRSYEGNCDLCFLKGRNKLKAIIRENPGCADWWIEMETVGKGQFSKEFSYADLVREVQEQPNLFDELPYTDEFDAECGLICAVGDE
jgi:3'-phosphoadenosine 5'-phosphosulfate sulfotransferase (PAPS reductase)/FAD synthetase